MVAQDMNIFTMFKLVLFLFISRELGLVFSQAAGKMSEFMFLFFIVLSCRSAVFVAKVAVFVRDFLHHQFWQKSVAVGDVFVVIF